LVVTLPFAALPYFAWTFFAFPCCAVIFSIVTASRSGSNFGASAAAAAANSSSAA
jgi:hypothetical protein